MVEIFAKFVGARSVYIAGETFEVEITVKPGKQKEENSELRLAWLSAQTHGQCSMIEGQPIKLQESLNEHTSFVPFKGEKGHPVYTSKPLVLACNTVLHQPITLRYKETLPTSLPPSFRGACLKYSFKVSIGGHVVGRKIKVLRLPLRLLPLPGDVDEMRRMMEGSEEDQLKPTNPFVLPPSNQTTLLDLAMEAVQLFTCRKTSGLYNITHKQGKIAELLLHKQSFRMGDDILAECTFHHHAISCIQFSVTLQCVEELLKKGSNKQNNKITNVAKQEEFCACVNRSSIHLPIPLTITPSFSTNIVSVNWRLHFEFVTSSSPQQDSSDTYMAPEKVGVEVMVWDLPIKIFPTNPLFVNKLSFNNSLSVNGTL